MARALLVIDVQREYFEGAFPIRHPIGHLGAILEVMDAAKKANIPTVVVRHHQPDPDSPVFRKGSDMWQLHADVVGRGPNQPLRAWGTSRNVRVDVLQLPAAGRGAVLIGPDSGVGVPTRIVFL